MKPKIDVVFPDIKSASLIVAEVEKIKLSRHRRRMELLLSNNVQEDILTRFEEELKRQYRLNSVLVHEAEKNADFEQERNVMYVTRKSSGKSQETETLGKAKVTDVIYGSAIRSELTPIKQIREDSGRVCLCGEVFGIETKDITSKKTGKSFHLVLFDVTDRSDSISCQMFIEADEKGDTAYSEVKSRLKVGKHVVVRGKAQYNDYARETIVMANGICETEPPPARFDDAEEKRVELHLHTQMSAMDGVSSAKELISRATEWGHKAIAITDH
ncbi:MAG: PHP domain-containing protein, partial [Clostridia bacterium]|nr:PHP domain-containing protein [Clostridia bacterium]